MKNNYPLVYDVLKNFHKTGILNEVILIGSWCLFFYKHHFKEMKQLSMVRTLDIDFLIPEKIKVKKQYDIPELLKSHQFSVVFKGSKGLIISYRSRRDGY
jgi:Protein of unknown function (DUF3620).